MMDGVKWSAGEGKRTRCPDSSKLPPAGTQWTTKPRPARRAGSPIKKQIEQRASRSPPVPTPSLPARNYQRGRRCFSIFTAAAELKAHMDFPKHGSHRGAGEFPLRSDWRGRRGGCRGWAEAARRVKQYLFAMGFKSQRCLNKEQAKSFPRALKEASMPFLK